MVVTLPFVLPLLLDLWPLGRLGPPDSARFAAPDFRETPGARRFADGWPGTFSPPHPMEMV